MTSSSTTLQEMRSQALSLPIPKTPTAPPASALPMTPTQNSSGSLLSWATGSSLLWPGSFWKHFPPRFQRGHTKRHMQGAPQSLGLTIALTCLVYITRPMVLVHLFRIYIFHLWILWTLMTTRPIILAGTWLSGHYGRRRSSCWSLELKLLGLLMIMLGLLALSTSVLI